MTAGETSPSSILDEAKEQKANDTDSNNNDAVESNVEKAPSQPPAMQPPPNGGMVAWLQVLAGFMLFFNTWGLLNTFAVFQTYYESGVLFQASSSDISWIGSIQSFLLQLTGLIAGPVFDRGHLRLLLFTGSFMVVFGYMMLSLCTEYWQALLAQAFCVGIGSGLLFTPTVSLLPTYFSTRMGLAVGIASSGSSLGGVIYPIVLYRLISEIGMPRFDIFASTQNADVVGFPWAVRTMAFIALATFFIPLAVMKMRIQPPKPRALIDWTAFKDVPFMTFTLGVVIVFIGNVVLIFYVGFYPLNKGWVDESLSFYLVAVFNAASVFGRILPNYVSDKLGYLNTITPITLLLGITIMCMMAVENKAGIIVETIVTGFFSGVVVALPPVCFRILTPNPSLIGTRIGQGFAIGGLGLLIGGPSAGAILGTSEPLEWKGLWGYGGTAGIVAGLIFGLVRIQRAGFALNKKA